MGKSRVSGVKKSYRKEMVDFDDFGLRKEPLILERKKKMSKSATPLCIVKGVKITGVERACM